MRKKFDKTNFEIKIREDFNNVIQEYVDELWQKYDADRGGTLDKIEVMKMVQEMVHESSQFSDFSYDEFELLFQAFDRNGDGVIQKDEMKMFLLELCGLDFEDNFKEIDVKEDQKPEKQATLKRAKTIEVDSGGLDNLFKLTLIYETILEA